MNQNGIFVARNEQGIFGGNQRNLLFDSGVVYGNNAAYDIRTQLIVGTYPGVAALAVDSASRRVFTIQTYLNRGFFAYDLDNFASVGADPGFPNIQAVYPQLVRWGRYGLAFTNNTTGYGVQTLYIGRSVLVP